VNTPGLRASGLRLEAREAMLTFALMLALTAANSSAAEVALALELPRRGTALGRATHGLEEVSTPELGLLTSVVVAWDRAWAPFIGTTVRAGRTGLGTPMALARLDLGLRLAPDWSCNVHPYLELGLGAESVGVVDPHSAVLVTVGGGPSLSLGLLGDPQGFRGLLGLRVTGALHPGAYSVDGEGCGFAIRPSNLGLGLFVGRLF
jgi:hypothetical protein